MDKLNHIAFICDGNGRWAKQQGRDRTYGHNIGSEVIKSSLLYLKDQYQVKEVSYFVFSTENWKRPKHEVVFIQNILKLKLKSWADDFLKAGVKIRFIGARNNLDKKLVKILQKYEDLTKDCTNITVNICFNYGSRDEIVNVVKEIITDDIAVDAINEDLFSTYLKVSDVDLLVRTSGERRISNFYLWQIAYSELIFLDCLWPDLNNEMLDDIIKQFYLRDRRFGGIKNES